MTKLDWCMYATIVVVILMLGIRLGLIAYWPDLIVGALTGGILAAGMALAVRGWPIRRRRVRRRTAQH